MALRFKNSGEINRQSKNGGISFKFVITLLVFWAVAIGLIAWMHGDSLESYKETVSWLIASCFASWWASRFYYEFRFRIKEISEKVSAIEETLKTLTERLDELPTPTFMHEYVSEQAAWKTTERLDGRIDSDIDEEHNPETHNLVVRGIKCFEIAEDYKRGLTVLENRELGNAWYRRAVQWYQLAAEKGDSYAQERLGDFYSEGLGVAQDTQNAFRWWRESANNGRVSIQYLLGQKYYFGQGVDKDLAEALFWFQIVSSHSAGFTEEKRQATLYGNSLPESMQVEVRERVRKWLEDHPARLQ